MVLPGKAYGPHRHLARVRTGKGEVTRFERLLQCRGFREKVRWFFPMGVELVQGGSTLLARVLQEDPCGSLGASITYPEYAEGANTMPHFLCSKEFSSFVPSITQGWQPSKEVDEALETPFSQVGFWRKTQFQP